MRLLNAFSLNMISAPADVHVEEVSLEQAQELAKDNESAVGHADTARVFEAELGVKVLANRMTISLGKSDVVLVGQYRGPRLVEGATELPEGATIQWLLVSVR